MITDQSRPVWTGRSRQVPVQSAQTCSGPASPELVFGLESLDFGVGDSHGNMIIHKSQRHIQKDERYPGLWSSSGFPQITPTMQAGQGSDGWMDGSVYAACNWVVYTVYSVVRESVLFIGT
jgi:hypothetical protein